MGFRDDYYNLTDADRLAISVEEEKHRSNGFRVPNTGYLFSSIRNSILKIQSKIPTLRKADESEEALKCCRKILEECEAYKDYLANEEEENFRDRKIAFDRIDSDFNTIKKFASDVIDKNTDNLIENDLIYLIKECNISIDEGKSYAVNSVREQIKLQNNPRKELILKEEKRNRRIKNALEALCEELPHLAKSLRKLVEGNSQPKISDKTRYLMSKNPITKLTEAQFLEVKKIAKKNPWTTRKNRKISPFDWVNGLYKDFIPGMTQTHIYNSEKSLYHAFLKMVSREKARLENEGKVEAADGLPEWLDVPADKDLVLRGLSDDEALRILDAREANRVLATPPSTKSERPGVKPENGYGKTRKLTNG